METAQIEINKVLDYLKANYLSINEKKCEFIIVRPNTKKPLRKESLVLNNIEIEETDKMTFLGTIFDNKNNYKPQIQKVISKMNTVVHSLIRAKYTLPYKSKLLIFNGLFKPITDYSCLVWLDKANKSERDTLIKLQKKAIRLVFQSRFNTHTNQLFQISKIIPFEYIYEKEAIIFCKKLQNNELPEIFHDLLGHFTDNKRSGYKNTIKIPSKYKPGHVFYNIVKSWNDSHESYRQTSKTKTTKSKIKTNIIESLKGKSCQKRKCYMCSRDAHVDFWRYAGKNKKN